MSKPPVKTVQLRTLLTEDQLDEIDKILREPYTLERTVKLRDYLVQHRESLEAKGVVPEYLTYVIEYEQMKAFEMFALQERKNAKNN